MIQDQFYIYDTNYIEYRIMFLGANYSFYTLEVYKIFKGVNFKGLK